MTLDFLRRQHLPCCQRHPALNLRKAPRRPCRAGPGAGMGPGWAEGRRSPGGAREAGVRAGLALGGASSPERALAPSSARWRLCSCSTLSRWRWAGVTAAALPGPKAAICSGDSSCRGEGGQHAQGRPSAGAPTSAAQRPPPSSVCAAALEDSP